MIFHSPPIRASVAVVSWIGSEVRIDPHRLNVARAIVYASHLSKNAHASSRSMRTVVDPPATILLRAERLAAGG